MVDRKLFAKAERKIAMAPKKDHAKAEMRGTVTERIHGQTYRLRWTIKRLKA